MKVYRDLFESIISPEKLFAVWDVFKVDKYKKPDVLRFEQHLEKNIFELHRELKNGTYQHGPYHGFYVHDPKQRHIHKASVRDRILHHAIFSAINPLFEPTFISRSFSCRIGYGTHRGVTALHHMARKISRNGMRDCFVLKCDIKRFFDSVDHKILISIIEKRIKDEKTIWLLRSIIESYGLTPEREREREREREIAVPQKRGIPIGNLTSQLFANVYMNELDQFIKHELHIKNYARYTDDFAIVSSDHIYLEKLIEPISLFLNNHLALGLHPKKVSIRKLYQGVDFLGYVMFPHHRLVRTKTKKRMFKNLRKRNKEYQDGAIDKIAFEQAIQSYLGVLTHANTHQLREKILNEFWIP